MREVIADDETRKSLVAVDRERKDGRVSKTSFQFLTYGCVSRALIECDTTGPIEDGTPELFGGGPESRFPMNMAVTSERSELENT